MADCCAYGVLHCRLIGLEFKLHRFYEHIVAYWASPVWDCSTGSLRCGFWGVAKLGAERAGLLWKWQCVAIGGMLRPALRNGVPVTIKARWNVHVTLTTALQIGLHAVSKVVRVTGCLGYEDHTQ